MPEKTNGEQKRDAFIMLPKKLLTDERYNSLSPVSIMIYSALADRASLSEKNGWIDSDGRVFIYFAINEMAKLIGCGRNKIINSFKQLEELGLIERNRQGQGKASKIYVNPIYKLNFKKSRNETSRSLKTGLQEVSESNPNNTYINNNYSNNTNLSVTDEGYDAMRRRVEEQIEYEYLCQTEDKAMLENIIILMTDTLCSTAPTVRIGGQPMAKSVVDARFKSLDEEHIRYVIERFCKNTTKIRNIRSYLLTALYNAPATIDGYYQSLVNRDFNLTG